MFLLAWTIIHRIDEESPFYGLNANTHADRIVALIIGFGGIDDTMAQTVHTRHVYTPEDFLYGYRFTDMIDSSTPGMLIIDHTQLDEVQPEGPNRN